MYLSRIDRSVFRFAKAIEPSASFYCEVCVDIVREWLLGRKELSDEEVT